MSSVTQMSSFDAVAEKWSSILPLCAVNTPFMAPQWQRVWWEEIGQGQPLSFLCFNGGDELLGIAALRIAGGEINLVGDDDVCDYNDFLVTRGNEASFFQALVDHLAQTEWTALRLPSLTPESPTLEHLPEQARAKGFNVEITEGEVSPGKNLPGNWDDYLAGLSKKNRHELRRKLRRLDTAEGMRWYHLTDADEIEDAMDDFLRLLGLSRESKYRFLTPERERFFRGMARHMSLLGLVRLFFLEIGGQRVASAFCFDHGDSRLLYNSGYDPEYSYYSVGLLLKALSLKSAIEAGKSYYDFLRGDEQYKYHLGGEDRQLYNMVVTKT